jgi:hypothetical protein
MTKALILDPLHSADDLGGFKRMARERQGWEFLRLNFAASQDDPVAYLPRILSAVESADVILCFGRYFWFNFCEGAGPDFYDCIEEKLSSGTPFFLEFLRAFEALGSRQLPQSMQQLFRRLGVMPTPNRIFTDLQQLEIRTY